MYEYYTHWNDILVLKYNYEYKYSDSKKIDGTSGAALNLTCSLVEIE